jgi:hypothetical protein
MSIARRSLLQGAVGGGAVLATGGSNAAASQRAASQTRGLMEAAQYLGPDPLRGPAVDPLYAVRRAFTDHAERMARIEVHRLERVRASLNRLRSTSEAWREYRSIELERQQQDVWERLSQLSNGIFS